jgi:hypothetical protein
VFSPANAVSVLICLTSNIDTTMVGVTALSRPVSLTVHGGSGWIE